MTTLTCGLEEVVGRACICISVSCSSICVCVCVWADGVRRENGVGVALLGFHHPQPHAAADSLSLSALSAYTATTTPTATATVSAIAALLIGVFTRFFPPSFTVPSEPSLDGRWASAALGAPSSPSSSPASRFYRRAHYLLCFGFLCHPRFLSVRSEMKSECIKWCAHTLPCPASLLLPCLSDRLNTRVHPETHSQSIAVVCLSVSLSSYFLWACFPL